MHKDIFWHQCALVLQNNCKNTALSRPRNAGTSRSTRPWAPEGASITSEIKLSPAVRRLSSFWMPMSALLFLSKRCSASRRNTENQIVLSSSGQQWDFILDSCCCPQKCRRTCLGSLLFPPTILIFRLVTFNNIATPWSLFQIFLILETSHIMLFFFLF